MSPLRSLYGRRLLCTAVAVPLFTVCIYVYGELIYDDVLSMYSQSHCLNSISKTLYHSGNAFNDHAITTNVQMLQLTHVVYPTNTQTNWLAVCNARGIWSLFDELLPFAVQCAVCNDDEISKR